MEELNIKSLAYGIGTAWGLYMLFLGWGAAFGWGAQLLPSLASIYIGFSPGFIGGIIGGVWGFACGAVFGAIIAWAYNRSKQPVNVSTPKRKRK